MDHLKEQLKKHYENVQPSEGFLQKLHTLEAPEPAPVPVRMSRKRLLTPIAAMLIAAVAILGGGKYLMDAIPPMAPSPEAAPECAASSDIICYGETAPTEADPSPMPECASPVQVDPEPGSVPESPPEKTAPEPDSADVTAPQPPTSAEPTDPAPPSSETTDPVPPENNTDPEPPPQITAPGDDPTPPPEDDVPPTTPGDDDPPYDPGDDDPPTDPGENDPVDPPDDPVGPPDEPVDPPEYPPDNPPDDPIYPEPHAPVISAYYANEDGQHIVYLTNRSTGESSPIDVTTRVTESGYHGTHNLFGYMIEVWLIPPLGDAPASDQNFHAVAEVIM